MLLVSAFLVAFAVPGLKDFSSPQFTYEPAIQRAAQAAASQTRTAARPDSILDGVFAGFLVGLGYGGLACALGLSGEHDPCGPAILAPALAGAALGGLIDFRYHRGSAVLSARIRF